MSADKYLLVRGDFKALAARGDELLLTTRHAEERPTAVYRLDVEKMTLVADPAVLDKVP